MNRWQAEFLLLGMAFTMIPGTVQAQTGTTVPAQSASGSDTLSSPLGIPASIWVTLIVGAGGYAVIGKGLGVIFNSLVSFTQAASENAPKRWQADLERDEVETLNLKQETEFLATMNHMVKEQGATIITLQTNAADQAKIITGMQANGLEQSKLITQMQLVSFERDKAHNQEIEKLTGRIDEMAEAATLREAELKTALGNAAHWKEQYDLEHTRAEDLAGKLTRAEAENERLRQQITGEHPAVNSDAPVKEQAAVNPDAPIEKEI